MAKHELIEAKIAEYREVIIEAVICHESACLDRLLRMFAKEIERETRHAAVRMAQQLSNDIYNL